MSFDLRAETEAGKVKQLLGLDYIGGREDAKPPKPKLEQLHGIKLKSP
jgi:hypothetical protein